MVRILVLEADCEDGGLPGLVLYVLGTEPDFAVRTPDTTPVVMDFAEPKRLRDDGLGIPDRSKELIVFVDPASVMEDDFGGPD